LNINARQELFARLQAHDPHPTTELHYENTFQLLIAVILSAQATDVSVNKATLPLFEFIKTPQQLLALGEESLKTYIKTIGLYNSKARHIMATCERLVTDYQGDVPNDRAALESLPGVGRKTANVILNTAFGQPTVAVDTHIFRLANRTGLAPGKTVLAVEQALLKNIPEAYLRHAHHWLILHGRYVCVARKPKCSQCIIADLCEFSEKIP
jgi:endonuclease III